MKTRSVFSTVAATAVMVLCVCGPALAATDGPDAFADLLANASVTGPGYYTSATRGVFMGGSTQLYVPNDTVDLISIAPPTLSAGCGGISLFFGGFSFISGAQLEQLVTEVMQDALGYALQLGIRVLCPMCSDILGELQKLAADAAKASRSSCQLAASLIDSATSHAGLGAFTGGTSNACSDLSSSQGLSTDYLDAMTSGCQGVTEASAWINTNITTLFASSPAQGSQAAAKQAAQQGNPLWASLTLAGYADTDVKEIFLSMEGFTSHAQAPGDRAPTLHQYPGWGPDSGPILLDLLLYGANPAATAAALPPGSPVSAGLEQAITDENQEDYKDLPFYLCAGVTGATLAPAPAQTPALGGINGIPFLRMCDVPEPGSGGGKTTVLSVATSGGDPLITPTGLLAYVGTTLTAAVQAIAAGQPIPAAAIELMQVTPLPVYRMVNIAAVYPDVANQLVANYSQFIGYLIAQSLVRSWIESAAQPVPGISVSDQGGAMQKQLAAVLKSITVSVKDESQAVDQALALQSGILASLQQVNDVMYQSLAGTGMQGNLMFTQGLAAGITQGRDPTTGQ